MEKCQARLLKAYHNVDCPKVNFLVLVLCKEDNIGRSWGKTIPDLSVLFWKLPMIISNKNFFLATTD